MNAGQKAVDVLADLDRIERLAESRKWSYADQESITSIRAAVAELILADKECDAIGAELSRIDMAGPRHNSYGTGWEVRDRAHRKEVEAKFDAACQRRAAALVRCGGVK